MIAYNKTWLLNRRLEQEFEKDHKHSRITKAEFDALKQQYPVGFYTPNLLVRIGMFILTSIVVQFSFGLVSLMFSVTGLIETAGWIFFLGIVSCIALEVVIAKFHHYRSGVDDALLFITACLFLAAIVMSLKLYNDENGFLKLAGLIFLLNLYLTIRYADTLMALVCILSFFAFIFLSWTKVVPGLASVPFVMMLIAGLTYWVVYVYGKRFVIYENCLIVAQIVSLVALYAAGNYFVVQTLSDSMTHQIRPIAFGAFFWVLTIGLPFVYIFFGIRKKDVVLLRVGLLLVAAAVATFRTYYHILPADVMLTIAGAILLGIVYAVMKYLKTPKHGFTYAEPDDTHLMDNLKVESLIVAETFSQAPQAPANDGVKFGGGDFGGGGSSGGF